MNNITKPSVLEQAHEISSMIEDARDRVTKNNFVDLTPIQGKVVRLYENVANEMTAEEIVAPENLSQTLSAILNSLANLERDMAAQHARVSGN